MNSKSLLPLALTLGLLLIPSGVRAEEFPLKTADIRVRDPFVVADAASQTYFLYAQTGNRRGGLGQGVGVEVYRSKDLTNWSAPTLAYRKPTDF